MKFPAFQMKKAKHTLYPCNHLATSEIYLGSPGGVPTHRLGTTELCIVQHVVALDNDILGYLGNTLCYGSVFFKLFPGTFAVSNYVITK